MKHRNGFSTFRVAWTSGRKMGSFFGPPVHGSFCVCQRVAMSSIVKATQQKPDPDDPDDPA
jgi:hypothetical protein